MFQVQLVVSECAGIVQKVQQHKNFSNFTLMQRHQSHSKSKIQQTPHVEDVGSDFSETPLHQAEVIQYLCCPLLHFVDGPYTHAPDRRLHMNINELPSFGDKTDHSALFILKE